MANIAFIAVRAGSRESEGGHEVVVVGSDGANDELWRYARFPLDRFNDLQRLWRQSSPTTAPPHPLGDPIALAAYGVTYGIETLSAGVLTGIVRCVFYRHGADLLKRQGLPLAVFDTCRPVDGKGSTDPAPPSPWTGDAAPLQRGSRLVLYPAGTDPGAISHFDLKLQIRTPLGVHAPYTGRVDLYDTRAIISLEAWQGTTPRNLWSPDATPPNGWRGAVSDRLSIGFTTEPADDDDKISAKSFSMADLGVFARKGVQAEYQPNPASRELLYSAALYPWAVGGARPRQNQTLRRFGLRAVAPHPTHTEAPSLVPRFELATLNRSDVFAGLSAAALAVLPSNIDELADPQPDVPINSLPLLTFAQEQRQAALTWELEPVSQVRWLFTITAPPDAAMTKNVVARADDVAEQIGQGLRSVHDARPLSLAPRFDLDTLRDAPKHGDPYRGPWAWQVVGFLTDLHPSARLLGAEADIEKQLPKQVRIDLCTFEPVVVWNLWAKPDALQRRDITVEASLPRLALSGGGRLNFRATLNPALRSPDAAKPANCTHEPCYQPSIADLVDIASAPIGVRLGLSLPVSMDAETEIGAFRFHFFEGAAGQNGLLQLRCLGREPDDALDDRLRDALDLRLDLAVSALSPAGEDPRPDADRITALERLQGLRDLSGSIPDAPLVFARSPGTSPPAHKYDLSVRETVTRGDDHTVTFSLRSTPVPIPAPDPAPAPTDLPSPPPVPPPPAPTALVIETAPFRVALVEYAEPTAASDDSQEVAVWNAAADGGLAWRIADDAQLVRLALPPQVVGEAMEKNSPAGGYPPDIREGAPAAARFGSVTRLDVNPTYFDARFHEPGWNLSRILGFAGQRSPGAQVRDLRLELLYGMTTRVTPRERVFVAELAAALGVPVLPLGDTADQDNSPLAAYIPLINRMIAIEPRRLAVDKLWRDTPDDQLVLDQGVGFNLRIHDDKAPDHGPRTALRWPIAGVAKDMPPGFSIDSDDATSFAGGVAWAFESPVILKKVYFRPRADGGRVRDVHLSAHGGWGGQRALFDEKRTAIDTETAQGRVHRYALERVGRIGGLWNRAKHVIVYERSVVPSAQFYNIQPIGKEQDELAGRPVLRKVEEYVELLETVRRYPEDGSSVSAAACIVGAEFKSRRIRVDSRWGSDVREEGWKVPLWNTAFADLTTGPTGNPDDPALLYPKPQIRLLMAGEGGGEIGCEIDEPEKLVFYTSVVAGEGDDTDTWRSVRGVDYLDLPPPSCGTVTWSSDDLSDVMLPAEPEHAAGYEPITLRLAPSMERAVITHGRTASGPAAVFKNVTLARSLPAPQVGAAQHPAAAGAGDMAELAASLRGELDRVLGQVLSGLSTLESTPDLEARAKAAVDRALDRVMQPILARLVHLSGAARALEALPPPAIAEGLGRQIDQAVAGQAGRLQTTLQEAMQQAEDRLDPMFDGADGLIDENVTAIKAATAQTWDAAKNAMQQALGRLDAPLAQAQAELRRLTDTQHASLASLTSALGGELSGASTAIASIVEDAEKQLADVRAKVLNTNVEWKQTLDAAGRALDAFDKQVAAAVRSPPPQARRLVLLMAAGLAAASAALRSVLYLASAPADTARASLADKLKKAHDAIEAPRAAIEGRVNTLVAGVSTIETALDNALQTGAHDITAWLKIYRDQIAHASKVVADLPSPGPAQATLDAAADALKVALVKAEGELPVRVRGLGAWANGTIVAAKQDIDNLRNQVIAQAAKLEVDCAKQLIQGAQDWIPSNPGSYFKELQDTLRAEAYRAIEAAGADLDQLRQGVADSLGAVTRGLETRVSQAAAAAQEQVRDVLGTDPSTLADKGKQIFQQGGTTLQLLRALADPPKTDTLGLNRPEVALVFREVNKVVDITPAIALANRVGDTLAAADKAKAAVSELLQSFGVRLPIDTIGEQLIPKDLKGLSIANLIPDMGGIDFKGLLQKARFPDIDSGKAVQLRHGFDQAELKAWLEADIDIPFAEAAELLQFGPVTVVIDGARFFAQARASAGKNGVAHSMLGRLSGDWRVVAGGQTIITFRQTGLFFDQSGKLDFRISPDRVEVAEALRFVTDLLAKAGQDDGLSVGPLMRGGVPVGVAATLDLKLPNLQTGVFGISDLWLHVMFGVSALPEFQLLCDVSVGSRMAPFTLNVWILNGGGYLTQRLSYLPTSKPKPLLTYVLDIGIAAGVGLGFSFGVVSGGVWLEIGCAVAITWTTAEGGGSTAIRVFILARGNVDVAGLITANVALLLDVSYDGNLMLGTGTLSISVRISIFFTLSVDQRVEYTFAGEKKHTSANYSDTYE